MSDSSSSASEKVNSLVREAAKWFVASAAAVGAALVAGSQLSNIGKLPAGLPNNPENVRFCVAITGACIGLSAVVFIVRASVEILLPVTVTLEDLVQHWDANPRRGLVRRPGAAAAVKFLKSNERKFLQGFESPETLRD